MLQTINLNPSCSAEERSSDLAAQLYTDQLCSSVIYGTDVTVNVKPTTHTSGSSLVTTKNITNYAWSVDNTPGSLIAIHCSGNFIAYAIKGPNGQGMVRIIHCISGVRGLIKNIAGVIRDVSFAYLSDQVLLACVDQFGSLFVHEIYNEAGSLRTELRIQVVDLGGHSQRAKWWHESGLQRVVWCPYIPEDASEEESDEDNSALMLTVTNGTAAEVWHLGLIFSDLDSPIVDEEIKIGYHMISEHSGAITDAAFSPDGTALATASMDGFVKFFQMKFETPGIAPRCLHQWNPHNSQPLSCLFFLDNYKHPNIDGLWKYAVTGANNNTELKVWSCQNWKCHQTINFKLSEEDNFRGAPECINFRASIDPSSRHIILSDVNRRVLCVAILNQDYTPDTQPELEEQEIHAVKFISISEIPIHMGAIYLAINDATFKIYKQWKDEYQLSSEECDDENDMKIVEGLVMRCYLINQKSLQEAMIKFQPCLPLEPLNKKGCEVINLSLSRDNSISLQDGLTDLSLTMNATTLDSQNNSMARDEGKSPIFPIYVPNENQDKNGILTPPQKMSPDKNEECILSPPPSESLPLNLLTPESFGTIPREELDILNEMGLHVGNMEDSMPGVNSTEDDMASKIRSSIPVSKSKYDITFNSDRKIKSSKEWGNKLNEAVASSPTTSHIFRSYNDDEEVDVGTSNDLLQPHTNQAAAVSSSTSSPSLEVQQILHNQNGKVEEYMDVDVGSDETEKMFEENATTKNLVDILTPFSIDKKQTLTNVWESQPPLLPTSQGMPFLTPDSMSVAKELLGLQITTENSSSDIFVSHDLADTKFLNTMSGHGLKRANSETEQATQQSEDGSQDSQLGLFQLKNLPSVSKHMTCEQLEAHMKNETPTSGDNFSTQFAAIQTELTAMKKALNSGEAKVNKQLTQHNKKLAQVTKQLEDTTKNLEKCIESLPNLVALNTKNGLENTIKRDIKPAIHQATKKSMDIVRSGLEVDIHSFLENMERHIADHISRILHSKAFIDNIDAAVSTSFSNSVKASVKECHSKVVVPSFNTSASQMFSQMNDAFSRGTKEYLDHVQAEAQVIESTIKEQLDKGCQNLKTASTAAENLAKNTEMTDMMESRLRLMIREELSKALQEQSALFERQSRTQTPLAGSSQSPFSVKNAQQQLQTYISRQEFNNAFKHALMLADLSLVVFVCERVNPHQLFSHSPCPLTQEVLLSLINQLSYDLSTYTDLKIKYLEDAVMTLDMNHQVTKEHLRQVLADCQRALTNHLSINPNQKKLKMLLLAVNQLLSSA